MAACSAAFQPHPLTLTSTPGSRSLGMPGATAPACVRLAWHQVGPIPPGGRPPRLRFPTHPARSIPRPRPHISTHHKQAVSPTSSTRWLNHSSQHLPSGSHELHTDLVNPITRHGTTKRHSHRELGVAWVTLVLSTAAGIPSDQSKGIPRERGSIICHACPSPLTCCGRLTAIKVVSSKT